MSIHMILASASRTRADLLAKAGVEIEVRPARLDEGAVKESLLAESTKPRDIADTLAEMKARKISAPGHKMVLGCDQVAELNGCLLSKPETRDACVAQLMTMSGKSHKLHSAAVIYQDGAPIWRHVGTVVLQMRDLSEPYLDDYTDRNWSSIRDSVGGYKLEEEGARFFTSIRGDYFHVLGLPLLEILGFLVLRGELRT